MMAVASMPPLGAPPTRLPLSPRSMSMMQGAPAPLLSAPYGQPPPMLGAMPLQPGMPALFQPPSHPAFGPSLAHLQAQAHAQLRQDAASEDGPASVAADIRFGLQSLGQKRPPPATAQYQNRDYSGYFERGHPPMPKPGSDVCGYVQAAVAGAGNYLAQNTEESQRIGHKHHDQRIVFAAISGWTLAFWQSYEDFEAARHHGPKGPAPIHWWDLRQVQDLTVDFEDINAVECPHRLRLLMLKGNLYFRVEAPEDVPVWVAAIRKVVEEAGWVYVKERDTPLHQQKRWPAAVGLARAVSSGAPIGERALAIAYHLYDIDFNTELRLGEIMLLILELHAAILTCEERAEGGDRLTAVVSAESRFHRGELFLRALHFRRRCCPAQAVAIKKDGFINNGHAAILEAFDLLPDGNPGHHPGDGGEACAVM
eukprot:TRINITY_DN10434_c0_g1_i1.p1 TRINITY_DN10434_c0_g1~~TRINITY_DN10434_c0_g1_i1.p1  ORF type:complete len:425 (-),score=88.62 TRINITY_DN10434_c0_g1_i1:116-1390(-)